MKKCFLICPIGEKDSEIRRVSDIVLKYIVSPVCKEYGFEVFRSDTEFTINTINDDIFNHLDNDELAIADLTGLNPNVFYEAGYRKAKGLPLIHIAREGTILPFDIKTVRTYFYDIDADKVESAKEALKNVIDVIQGNKASESIDIDVEMSDIFEPPAGTDWGNIFKLNVYNSTNNSLFVKDIRILKSSMTFHFIKEQIKLIESVTKRNGEVINKSALLSQYIPFKVPPNDFVSGYFAIEDISNDVIIKKDDIIMLSINVNDKIIEKKITVSEIRNTLDLKF